MTVNERLFVCGLTERFDIALGEWDVETLQWIFAEIGLEGYDLQKLRKT